MIPGITANYPISISFNSTKYSIGVRYDYTTSTVFRYDSIGRELQDHGMPSVLPMTSSTSTTRFTATLPNNLPACTIFGSSQIVYLDAANEYAIKTFPQAGVPLAPGTSSYVLTSDYSKFIVTLYNSPSSFTTKVYEMDWNDVVVSRSFDVELTINPAVTGSNIKIVSTTYSSVSDLLMIHVDPDGTGRGCSVLSYSTPLSDATDTVYANRSIAVDYKLSHSTFSSDGQDYMSVIMDPEDDRDLGLVMYRMHGTYWMHLTLQEGEYHNIFVRHDAPVLAGSRYLSLSREVPSGPYKQFAVVGAIGARMMFIVGKLRSLNEWYLCHVEVLEQERHHGMQSTWTNDGWGIVSYVAGPKPTNAAIQATTGVQLLDINPINGRPKGIPILKPVTDYGTAAFHIYGNVR